MSEGDQVSSVDNLDFPLGDPPQIPEDTHHHRKTLLGICFWREDRGNGALAAPMGGEGGDRFGAEFTNRRVEVVGPKEPSS
mgnify:CR=1 FL=1